MLGEEVFDALFCYDNNSQQDKQEQPRSRIRQGEGKRERIKGRMGKGEDG